MFRVQDESAGSLVSKPIATAAMPSGDVIKIKSPQGGKTSSTPSSHSYHFAFVCDSKVPLVSERIYLLSKPPPSCQVAAASTETEAVHAVQYKKTKLAHVRPPAVDLHESGAHKLSKPLVAPSRPVGTAWAAAPAAGTDNARAMQALLPRFEKLRAELTAGLDTLDALECDVRAALAQPVVPLSPSPPQQAAAPPPPPPLPPPSHSQPAYTCDDASNGAAALGAPPMNAA